MVTVLVTDEEVAAERECMVLGSPAPASIDGGFAFHGRPAGLVVDPAGSLYVSDATSRTVRRVGNGGAPAVVAGPASGISGTAGRRVLSPVGLALAGDGSILVADTTGHRIWAVSPAGWLRLVAGSVYGYRNGPGAEAQFRFPSGVAIGPDGTCYVADTGSDRISTITPDGLVATLAGSPPGGDRDGAGVEVRLCWPTGLSLGGDGDLWVADHGNGALRRIDRFGASTTHLRLSGRHWPVAVARAPDGAVIVAVGVLDDLRRPRRA